MQKRKFSQKCWEILALPTKTVGYTCLKFETRPSTCGFGLTYQNTDQFHPIPTKPMLDVSTPRLTISTVLTCGLLLFMCCLFSAIEEVFFHLQQLLESTLAPGILIKSLPQLHYAHLASEMFRATLTQKESYWVTTRPSESCPPAPALTWLLT